MSSNEQWGQQKARYDWGSQPASSGYYSNVGNKRSNSLQIVVVVILVAVALAAGAGLFYWWLGSSDHDGGAGAAATSATETQTEAQTETAESSTERREDRETTTTRAPEPVTQVNFSGGRPGTSVTSGPFAESVYRAYMDNYRSTGQINARIDAYSPVTGQMYPMNCTGNTSAVTCRGGNNAVVHIS